MRPDRVRLTQRVGYEGTAEPAEPLNEDGDDKIVVDEPMGAPVPDQQAAPLSMPVDLSTEGLTLITKLICLALIVAVCYGYVRAHSPRRTGPAGRHGAYEKGGLP